jgi:sulfoxide reductase heme-binding subunit YedZ
MAARALPWLKPAVHLAMAAPLLWLARGWAELLWRDPGSLILTAEPVAYTHNSLGLMALRALLLSLACTPVRRLTGWGQVMTLRRLLGLWAFAYAALHLGFYVWAELDWSLADLWAEVAKRPFILAGMVGLSALLPLALTSTAASIKRLGARRWQLLHRLAYLAGIAACVHFILRVKGFQWEPWIYLGILVVLLAVRLFPVSRRGSANRGAPPPAGARATG